MALGRKGQKRDEKDGAVGAPTLRIRLTKRGSGAILSCTRADGSTTWQKHEGHQAAFFPVHDIIHYAVETGLGLDRGFFGLVAAGWDIEDTTGKGGRGPVPPEATVVEHVVSLLAVERSDGRRLSAPEFNAEAASFAESRILPVPGPLTEEDLASLRTRMGGLFARWRALAEGGALDLEFPSPSSLDPR